MGPPSLAPSPSTAPAADTLTIGASRTRASPCRIRALVPETNGIGRVFLIGALAVVFGLAAASLLAAALGDRWGARMYGHHRLMSLLVGLGYLSIGLIVLATIRQA